jgi:nucleoside diphosphate kinase
MVHTARISFEKKFIVAKGMKCFAEVVRHLMNSELIVRLVSGRDEIHVSRKLENMLFESEVMCNSCCHLNGRNAFVA